MDKVTALREKHPVFSYENFAYKQEDSHLVISFSFKISPGIEFNPHIKIEDINNEQFTNIDKKVLENFIFNLGLVEMISYWKATCSPKIEIKAGAIDKKQITWWKNLIIKGLGEFFYQNNINFKNDKFVEIENKSESRFEKDVSDHTDRYLVLNGGGKDSAVAFEILKEIKKDCTILMLNPTSSSLELAGVSDIGNKITVERKIDSRLLELNSKGYLNGHTPFSAYLAFLSLVCALILNYRYIVVSNESSANEENVDFLGEKINHQFSKSFEFEKEFREYVSTNLSENIKYLSVLRPLYELQISKIFANYPKYFGAFKSCNKAQKDNAWCGKCPKCLSTYITLYPFIETEKLNKIFNRDLYTSENLTELLLYITGVRQPKPFECVGTYEELREGLKLSIKKFEDNNRALPPLLAYAKENILDTSHGQSSVLTYWDQSNFLPNEFEQALKAKI